MYDDPEPLPVPDTSSVDCIEASDGWFTGFQIWFCFVKNSQFIICYNQLNWFLLTDYAITETSCYYRNMLLRKFAIIMEILINTKCY